MKLKSQTLKHGISILFLFFQNDFFLVEVLMNVDFWKFLNFIINNKNSHLLDL